MLEKILQPGSVISVPKGPVRHFGIVDWHSAVIHASKKSGMVVCESLEVFADGKPVRQEGYPGNLPPEIVVARAEEWIGTPYRLFTDNCDHLYTDAHGLKRKSPQVKKALLMAGTLLVTFIVARRARLV